MLGDSLYAKGYAEGFADGAMRDAAADLEKECTIIKDAIVSALRLYGSSDLSVTEIDSIADRYLQEYRKKHVVTGS